MLKRGRMKRGPFKRSVSPEKLKGVRKSKRGKIKALWASYGLTVPLYRRYTGRKGIYWWLLSRKVRQRDFKKYNGECIDQCGGRAETWQEMQGGHFVPARFCGFGLLFDEVNVNAQLAKCNNPRISPLSGRGYGIGLDKRYGVGTAEELLKRRHNKIKEWSQGEYDHKIKQLIQSLV